MFFCFLFSNFPNLHKTGENLQLINGLEFDDVESDDDEYDEEDESDDEYDEEDESDSDEESEEETSKDEKSNEDESYNEESNEDGSYNEESNEDESYDEESNVEDIEFLYQEFNVEDIEFLYQIKRFSFEIASKCGQSANPHSTVIYFLKMLSTYSWEAKLFIMLAAFSINIGEFNLVHRHKGLASKLTNLNGCDSAVAPSHIYQSLTQFIISLIYLTHSIVELAQSSSYNLSPVVPVACYWIITSILTCAPYFAPFLKANSEWLIANGNQLSSLTTKINDLITYCHQILEKKREEESYKALWDAFSDENEIPSTNLDVLKLLFNVNDGDEKPIYDGAREELVEFHLLENKSLLLLISSSLNIDEYLWEILIGLRWTTELPVFWIPILDDCPALRDSKILKKQYRDLADRGSLVIARNLKKVVTPRFIRFVKEKFFPEFQIGGEPIIVSLDHHGKIVHRNALHMILMRAIDYFERISTIVSKGHRRIPLLKDMLREKTSALRDFVPDIDKRISKFADKTNKKINAWLRRIEEKVKNPIYSNIYTRERENDLWKEKEVSWCTKLMASRQGSPINKWADKKNYIFFIGGNSIQWVKIFVSKVVSQSQFNSKWKIKMAYIGSNMEVASVINRDEICMAPDDELSIPFFWARLRSIFLSRIRFLNESHCDEGRDEIVEGLKKLLAYEDKGLVSPVDGWAMLCKGNKIVVCDLGDNMLTVMNEFEKWKESAIAKGFDRAFKAHHEKKLAGTTTYASQCHPCCALDYPSNFDEVPKNVKCPQCWCNMQKFETFMCSHGYDSKVDDDEDDNEDDNDSDDGDDDDGGGDDDIHSDILS